MEQKEGLYLRDNMKMKFVDMRLKRRKNQNEINVYEFGNQENKIVSDRNG